MKVELVPVTYSAGQSRSGKNAASKRFKAAFLLGSQTTTVKFVLAPVIRQAVHGMQDLIHFKGHFPSAAAIQVEVAAAIVN